MKITFITTKIQPHAMNLAYTMDLVGRKFATIPLPLATLAALTPSEINCEIIDENIEDIPLSLSSDIIVFTGISCQKERLFELAKHFKSQGKFIAIGGPVVDAFKEECLEVSDSAFIGEGEYTWPQFIKDYQEGNLQSIYHEKNNIDIHDSPIPRFDLIKYQHYVSGAVQATRGCPYGCEYCDVPAVWGKKARSKKITQVIEEIKIQAQFHVDSIFIVDDHFAANSKYAKELLRAIAQLLKTLPKQLYFYTQVPINVAKDAELLDLMKAANMRRLFIGIESSDQDKLITMNKLQNNQVDIRTAIDEIQKRGIVVWAGILFGYDGETKASFDKELNFIKETGISPMLIGLVQALPNTPLFERMQEEQRVKDLPIGMGSAATGDNRHDPSSNIIFQTDTEKELNINFCNFIRTIYQPETYTDFILKGSAKEQNSGFGGWPDINWNNIKLVSRIVWHFSTTSKAKRKMLGRFMWSYITGKSKNIEELFFHLGIYKHMDIFYTKLAENIEANS